jgi:hypothetical protein
MVLLMLVDPYNINIEVAGKWDRLLGKHTLRRNPDWALAAAATASRIAAILMSYAELDAQPGGYDLLAAGHKYWSPWASEAAR